MIVTLGTGGYGFIGSNFVRYILEARKKVKVINIDLLSYAGNLANLVDVENDFADRYHFIKGDITDKRLLEQVFEQFNIDWIVHFAAESHVDRSILGPEAFVRTNIYGTLHLLETCRECWPLDDEEEIAKKRFLHISTDEVYGLLGESGCFTENSLYAPSSPY
jgi:dTDP-glucose 4,6-dehydratase